MMAKHHIYLPAGIQSCVTDLRKNMPVWVNLHCDRALHALSYQALTAVFSGKQTTCHVPHLPQRLIHLTAIIAAR